MQLSTRKVIVSLSTDSKSDLGDMLLTGRLQGHQNCWGSRVTGDRSREISVLYVSTQAPLRGLSLGYHGDSTQMLEYTIDKILRQV